MHRMQDKMITDGRLREKGQGRHGMLPWVGIKQPGTKPSGRAVELDGVVGARVIRKAGPGKTPILLPSLGFQETRTQFYV